ncbi:MAG: hypothetical protein LBS98_02915, partial [Coriobacteriales bacterium]|nr:hypothetical protein [Coriobacteriales bacterium]
ALIKQREDIKGHSAEDGTEDFGEAAITHVKAFTALDLEVGVENCRSFTKRAALALALENAWAREDGDKPEGDLFWATPPYISHGSIVEAILATFNFVMDAPFEWRTCEHCGRIFKFQKEYDPKNRYRKSTFCRNSCRVMHAQQLKAAANSGGTGSKVGSINTTNTKSSRWSYSPKRKPKG